MRNCLFLVIMALVSGPALANSIEGKHPLQGYPIEQKVQIPVNVQTLSVSRFGPHGCENARPGQPCDPLPPKAHFILKWAAPYGVFPVDQFEADASVMMDVKTLIAAAAKNGGLLEGILKVELEEQNTTYGPVPSKISCYRHIYQGVQLEIPKYNLNFAGRILKDNLGGFSLDLPTENGPCDKADAN